MSPDAALGNTRAHQGLMYDAEIGSYNNRPRQYAPGLRRFMQRDPLASVPRRDHAMGPNLSQLRIAVCNLARDFERFFTNRGLAPPPELSDLILLGCGSDPWQGALVQPGPGYQDGMNLYAYASLNPPARVDPQGLDPDDDLPTLLLEYEQLIAAYSRLWRCHYWCHAHALIPCLTGCSNRWGGPNGDIDKWQECFWHCQKVAGYCEGKCRWLLTMWQGLRSLW